MKRTFTLVAGFLIALSAMAAGRWPMVTISNPSNYIVTIDGQTFRGGYNTVPVSQLNGYRHTVRVYEVSRGWFGGRHERLLSTSYFQSDRDDINIQVDRWGNVTVYENRNRGYDDRDRRYDNDRRYDRDNRNGCDNDRNYDRRNDRRGGNEIFDKRDSRRNPW